MPNRQIVEDIDDLRGKTMAKYVKAPGAEGDIHRQLVIDPRLGQNFGAECLPLDRCHV